jgi:hypothetical protein
MEKKKGISVPMILFLLIIILAGAAAYYFWQKGILQEKVQKIVSQPPDQARTDFEEEEESYDIKEEATTGEAGIPLPESQSLEESQPEEDAYAQMEREMVEYFAYLDGRGYVRDLLSAADSYGKFKKVARKLAANPPTPGGESKVVMAKNVTHFYRVLGKDDLFMIKEIMANEQKSLEFDIKMFYKWLTLGNNYSNPENIRPSDDVVYRYAGFFLDTIGGRAYLFRRTVALRLLVSYYCVLIVHDADKAGKNTYGIDVLPNIKTLREEISNYPDFKFSQEYIDQLTAIDNYYEQKRQ